MSEKQGKLVRDKIPEIIEANGELPLIRVVEDNGEYDQLLQDKLYEELEEFFEEPSAQEAGDVQEVWSKLLERTNLTSEQADQAEAQFGDLDVRKDTQAQLYEAVGQFFATQHEVEAGWFQTVWHKILERSGVSKEDVYMVAAQKREQRGGFDNRIYLIGVENDV